jgi:hypothetical protein
MAMNSSTKACFSVKKPIDPRAAAELKPGLGALGHVAGERLVERLGSRPLAGPKDTRCLEPQEVAEARIRGASRDIEIGARGGRRVAASFERPRHVEPQGRIAAGTLRRVSGQSLELGGRAHGGSLPDRPPEDERPHALDPRGGRDAAHGHPGLPRPRRSAHPNAEHRITSPTGERPPQLFPPSLFVPPIRGEC